MLIRLAARSMSTCETDASFNSLSINLRILNLRVVMMQSLFQHTILLPNHG